MTSADDKTLIVAMNIAKYRKLKKLSQTKLGIMLGISREYIAKIETGLRHPSLGLLFKIAEVLNIEPKDLFEK